MEPEQLLGLRQGGKAHGTLEVLIKWKGFPNFEATWKGYEAIWNQFPLFHLEDKVRVWEGDNDRPLVRFTYQRKKSIKGRSKASHVEQAICN